MPRLIGEAKQEGCSVKALLKPIGLPRSTFYTWISPRKRRLKKPRVPKNKLTEAERKVIERLLCDQKTIDLSIYQLFYHHFNRGTYIASLSSFYRVARSLALTGDRRGQATHPKRQPPILLATKPDQVWCWDISRIPGPVAGLDYFLFALIDLFSRFVVGWMLADRENARLASHFLRESVRRSQGERNLVWLTTHSDRGAAMMALQTQQFLDDAGIKSSYSRPRVSDDNAFIESFFKTLKYHAVYPGFFRSKDEAETWLASFVTRYHHAPHSGLRGYTPHQAYTGNWHQAWACRQKALNGYHRKHPHRFKTSPMAKPLPNLVTINVSRPQEHQIQRAGIPEVFAPIAITG